MTIDEFRELNMVQQNEIVNDSGTFLYNYVQGNYMYDIYETFDFYVRFCYNVDTDRDSSVKVHAYPINIALNFQEN